MRKNVDNHFDKNLIISQTRLFLHPLFYHFQLNKQI